MPSEFTQTRLVEFAETDMAGIVHFANYFYWMEACELAFYRSLDLPLINFFPGQVSGWPRVNVSCEFHAPFRFGDTIQVQLLVQKIGTRAITYAFRFRKMMNGAVEPAVLARGTITAVCVSGSIEGGMVAHAIPPDVRAKFTEASVGQLGR
ncbi:MAG: acyl-CoA thioesterase [Opitutales bacterium]